VQWGNDQTPHVLRLADSDGLVSWRTLRGTWVSREQELLEARIAERPEGWKVSREVAVEDLGGEDVLVPDLVLVHEATGRRAYVEIAGFWRKAWLQRRAAVLAEHGPPNLVVCVSKRMATEKGDTQGAIEILPFAEVILWPKLRAIVERVAR
jgi:predicted nuclease of restriction endonuclease-like RecB superfamily